MMKFSTVQLSLRNHLFIAGSVLLLFSCTVNPVNQESKEHVFNGSYENEYLNRIAFPMGGIGAGMIALEGTGGISHVSVRNKPDIFNEPFMFAAITVKGIENGAKVLEGPMADWKVFGNSATGNGMGKGADGYPHFEKATFSSRFPFATVNLEDADVPLEISITGWSPFIPGDADNSSLPVASLEYTLKNSSGETVEALFSFHSENFIQMGNAGPWWGSAQEGSSVSGIRNGFLLRQSCMPDNAHYKGDFAVFTDHKNAVTDLCWFRGGWFDSRTMIWKNLSEFTYEEDTTTVGSNGASLYIPVEIEAGEEETIRLQMAWHVPHSDLRIGPEPTAEEQEKSGEIECDPASGCCPPDGGLYYEPWYSGRFKDISDMVKYWTSEYNNLRSESQLFSNAFYNSTLPDEVLEAVAANLTILKSPTVLRQKDGRLWAWEGCHDASGCCHGTCTHVWNYAQAIPHLFPDLERTLRETEFEVSQDQAGHQTFRTAIPIRQTDHNFHAASDGQLGGIMKMHREWRISGDTKWMKEHLPAVKRSLDYCISQWDPEGKGILEEPHHNTYDIEFWGPDGMCTSFYLGALKAFTAMGLEAGLDVSGYQELFNKGKKYMEEDLYNGEYFIQKIQWEGLRAVNPVETSRKSYGGEYSPEALAILEREGPKYQYGNGCISDGILGSWIGEMCYLDNFLEAEKVKSHLVSVHTYNFKPDLSDHVNPQRPGYAIGDEGGLLLCSWPAGDEPSLPFVYSNEVWTGIEYQVASHLMIAGEVDKGLDIVRAARNRYDGRIRNPFNEYECGHWYARAMSSYGMLEGLTGIQYDAVEQSMLIDSRVGNSFSSFFSTQSGWGNIEVGDDQIVVRVAYGYLDLQELNFTHDEHIASIGEITAGSEEVQSSLAQEGNQHLVQFGKIVKLDQGEELIVAF
ncbi:MAG: GH116 family glycosyl hydrolase [Bacteroidota bacterium]